MLVDKDGVLILAEPDAIVAALKQSMEDRRRRRVLSVRRSRLFMTPRSTPCHLRGLDPRRRESPIARDVGHPHFCLRVNGLHRA
jgi:hypothetical protein